MTDDLLTWGAVLALLAAVALAWRGGQRIVARRDEPTLPELLMAHRVRLILLSCLAGGLASYALGTAWALVGAILIVMLAAFPSRRRLFEERWSFLAWVTQIGRLIVGLGGVPLLLAFSPLIVSTLGDRWWVGSLALTPVLIAWSWWFPSVARVVLAARPVQDAVLLEGFNGVAERSHISRPLTLRAGHPGGRLANAVALVSVFRHAVVLGETLLRQLRPAETIAIFAHELAHIEERAPRNPRRVAALTVVFVLLACVAVPFLLLQLEVGTGGSALVAVALLVALIAVAISRRPEETRCDLRAAELIEDPESLVSALLRLYQLNLVPRRTSVASQRMSTHPGLAERIRAIREASGIAVEVDDSEPVDAVLAARQTGSFVVLQADHVHRLDGVPADAERLPEALLEAAASRRTQSTGELAGLRLQPVFNRVYLVAEQADGGRWRVSLAPEAVAAAHDALDRLDLRLVDVEKKPRRTTSRLGHIVARGLGPLLGLVALVNVVPRVLILPLILVAIRPTAAPTAACAAAFLVAAAMLYGIPPGWAGEWWQVPGQASLLGVSGLLFLLVLRQVAQEPRGSRTGRVTVALLGVAAVVWCLPPMAVVLDAGSSYAVHAAFRARPEATLLALGAAAAMLAMPGPWRRRLVGPVASVALLPAALASLFFLRGCAEDPLQADTTTVVTTLQPELVQQQVLEEWSWWLRLSPGGALAARDSFVDEAALEVLDETGEYVDGAAFVVGRPGQPDVAWFRVFALDVRFIDDEYLLVIRRSSETDTELARYRFDDEHGLVEEASWDGFPGRDELRLRLNASRTRWLLSGWNAGDSDLIWGRGPVDLDAASGAPELYEAELAQARADSWGNLVVAAPGRAAVALRMHSDWLASSTDLLPSVVLPASDLVAFESDGRAVDVLQTHLELACEGPFGPESEAVCVASDRDRTFIWTLASTQQAWQPRCTLPAAGWDVSTDGSSLLVNAEGATWVVALDGAACRVGKVGAPDGCLYIQAAALSGSRLAMLTECDDQLELRVYLIDMFDGP